MSVFFLFFYLTLFKQNVTELAKINKMWEFFFFIISLKKTFRWQKKEIKTSSCDMSSYPLSVVFPPHRY